MLCSACGGSEVSVTQTPTSVVITVDGVSTVIPTTAPADSGSTVSVTETASSFILVIDGVPTVIPKGTAVTMVQNSNGTITLVVDGTSVTLPSTTYVSNIVNNAIANIPDAQNTVRGLVELAVESNYPQLTNNVDAATPAYVNAAIEGAQATVDAGVPTDPPAAGTSNVYFDTSTSPWNQYVWDGSAWNLVGDGAGGGGADGTVTGVAFNSTTNVLTITSTVGGPFTVGLGSLAGGGGGGLATNLSYTASPTNGVISSSTGADASVPLASTTNAGLAPRRSGSASQFLNGAGAYSAIQSASATAKGIVELATTGEAVAGTSTTLAVTPAGLAAATPDSSVTVRGLVELATTAETLAGTDATRAVTPAGLNAALDTISPCTAVDATAAEIAALTGNEQAVVCIGGQPRAVPISAFAGGAVPAGVYFLGCADFDEGTVFTPAGGGFAREITMNSSGLHHFEFTMNDGAVKRHYDIDVTAGDVFQMRVLANVGSAGEFFANGVKFFDNATNNGPGTVDITPANAVAANGIYIGGFERGRGAAPCAMESSSVTYTLTSGSSTATITVNRILS